MHRPRDGNWEMLVDSHPDVIAEREAYQSALADLEEARADNPNTRIIFNLFYVGYLGQQHCGNEYECLEVTQLV